MNALFRSRCLDLRTFDEYGRALRESQATYFESKWCGAIVLQLQCFGDLVAEWSYTQQFRLLVLPLFSQLTLETKLGWRYFHRHRDKFDQTREWLERPRTGLSQRENTLEEHTMTLEIEAGKRRSTVGQCLHANECNLRCDT